MAAQRTLTRWRWLVKCNGREQPMKYELGKCRCQIKTKEAKSDALFWLGQAIANCEMKHWARQGLKILLLSRQTHYAQSSLPLILPCIVPYDEARPTEAISKRLVVSGDKDRSPKQVRKYHQHNMPIANKNWNYFVGSFPDPITKDWLLV